MDTRSGGQVHLLILAVAAVLVVLIINFVLQALNPPQYSEADALSLLQGKGYTIFSSSEYSTINSKLDDILQENRNISYVYPETANLTATINGASSANNWSAWQEITDSTGNKFSSEITSETHLNDTRIEYCSNKNETYMYQIAYGDTKAIVCERRLYALRELVEYPIDLKFTPIPTGSKVYARCMCTKANEYCNIQLRYHYHN